MGDDVIIRNFKHTYAIHQDYIYKTWGRSKLYLENCGQEVSYKNVNPLYIFGCWQAPEPSCQPHYMHANL